MPMRSQKSGGCREARKSQRSRRGSASAKPIFLIGSPPLHMLNPSLPAASMDCSVIVWLPFHLPCAMKPGTPVFTTSFNLCLVRMRLISLKASSGSAEMSKFSLARAALLGVVSKAVPRWTAHASSTCAGVFPTRAAIARITGSSSSPGFSP
jgi:hypothetical protein